jgi:hypothetical protein
MKMQRSKNKEPSPFTILVSRSPYGGWTADMETMIGCRAGGRTPADAVKQLRKQMTEALRGATVKRAWWDESSKVGSHRVRHLTKGGIKGLAESEFRASVWQTAGQCAPRRKKSARKRRRIS